MSELVAKFKSLSPIAKAAVIASVGWNVTLSVITERDLHRRPPAQVRGPKPLWRLACLTNSVGPLAYLRWGRRDVR